MKFTVSIKPGAQAAKLGRIAKRLSDTKPLMQRLGQRFESVLQGHFRRLDRRPNRRGWKKTGLWGKMARATSFVTSDAKSATVAVQNGKVFGAKVHGAHIRPKRGKKFLAIPNVESRYGVSPSSLDRSELVFRKTRKGGLLGVIRADGNIDVHYWLVREARTPRDPDALPKKEAVNQELKKTITRYLHG